MSQSNFGSRQMSNRQRTYRKDRLITVSLNVPNFWRRTLLSAGMLSCAYSRFASIVEKSALRDCYCERRSVRPEMHAWIGEDRDDEIFSLRFICRRLDLNYQRARSALLREFDAVDGRRRPNAEQRLTRVTMASLLGW